VLRSNKGSQEAPGSKALPQWAMEWQTHIFLFFFGFESTQLARRVQPKRTHIFFFFLVWYPRASIPSTADTQTGADAVLGKPEGSPARRHSRSSCHMSVYIVVCACSRHELDFKVLLFRSFVPRKGYCVTISRRSESIRWSLQEPSL